MKRFWPFIICVFLLSLSFGHASSVNYVGDSIDPAADETITGQWTFTKSVHVSEITTPTAIPDFAALYSKSDDHLYFQDGAGVEHVVSLAGDAYGEMYAATTQAQSIAESGTWYEIGTFTAGTLHGVTFGSDRLTVPFDGDYEVEWTASTDPGFANKTFSVGIGINGADPTTKYITQRRYTSADIGVRAGQGIATLTAGQYVNLMVKGDSDSTDIDFNFCNVELHKL